MARKKAKFVGASVKCDKCGLEAVGVSGSSHRRCSGQLDQPRRHKNDKLPREQRGTWN